MIFKFYVRKEFLIVVISLVFVLLAAFYSADRDRFSGAQYYAPETLRAVFYFKKKCNEYKVVDICDYGFKNLIRIDIVNKINHISSIANDDTMAIGIAEFSLFSDKTKISIDSKIMPDRVLFDTTIIHELGHAVLNLEHREDKLAIMNATTSDIYELKQNYKVLIDEMFNDFKNSLN